MNLNTSVLEDVMLWITDLKGASDDEGNDEKNYRGTLISSGLVILAGILVGFTSIQGKWLNVVFYSDAMCACDNHIL